MLTWAGCLPEGPGPTGPGLSSQQLLEPVAVKIHPSSAVTDKGLAVACEIRDRFGDPVKTIGVMRFEAYSYARSQPANKGPRVGFWPGVRIDSLETIQKHWDGIWGLYRFDLTWDKQFRPGQRFVLVATLTTSGGKQLSDSHVLEVPP